MRTIILALALIAASSSAPAETLRVAGNRLFVPVEVNGVAAEGLLDSAAEMTLLDAGFAERLGLAQAGRETARGTGGTAEVRFARGVDLQAVGVSLGERRVAILDLSDISERLIGEPVAVIVGRELFDAARLFLDIESGIIEPAPDAEPAGHRLPLLDHQGIKQFPVRIDGVDVMADFDLGNGSEVLIGRGYAEERKLLRDERIIGAREGGGIGGQLVRTLIRLDSLVVAGSTFDDVVAAVDPTEDAPSANVGVSVLRHFVMTIDFSGNVVWLAPRSGGETE